MKDEYIGQIFAYYEIIGKSDERDNYGKALYIGKCIQCGAEFIQPISKFKLIKGDKCKHKKIYECLLCGVETKNRKFCSHNCSAIYHNKRRTRRIWVCINCGTEIKYSRKYCDNCRPNIRNWNNITLEQLKDENKDNFHSKIRDNSKRVYDLSDKPKYCIKCGYSKHYEVCHIKGINKFDNNSYISEVNNLDNLIALCPNCHWELDNGLLNLSE